MKTAIKLAKTNKRLPILQTIIVRNGTAYATDLDMEISTASDMPEGIYHAEGFGSLNVKAEFPMEDIPERLAVDKYMGSLDIACEELAWIAGAMSNEETRYYLCGVFFDGTGGAAVATDGHILNKLALNVPSAVKHIIPAQAINMALSMAKEVKEKRLQVNFYDGKAVFVAGRYSLVTKIIDGTFPDYERVIPAKFEHVILWGGIDAAAYKEIKTLAKIEGVKTPVLKCNGAIKAYGREYSVTQEFPFEIGFNADYLAAVMPGAMGLNDARAPVTVMAGDRLTVVMPMRI